MLRRKPNRSGSFCRPDPNCTSAPDQRERVIADYLTVLDRKLDHTLGVRTRVTEFVSDLKGDPRHIDPVCVDLVVVGRSHELLINAFA